MLTNDNARLIIEELKQACTPETFHLILSDLILKNSIDPERQKLIKTQKRP